MTLKDNKVARVAQFLNKTIMTKFGFPFIEFISDRGTHFINFEIEEPAETRNCPQEITTLLVASKKNRQKV